MGEWAPLVWINGLPATGKLTIARQLQALDYSYIVIDNHQLIDPVGAKYSRDHPSYQHERRAEREKCFQKYVLDPKFRSHTIVFTDCQSYNDLGQCVAKEYEAAALKVGRPLVPVYLRCDRKVNMERITSPDRLQSTSGKLKDPETFLEVTGTVLMFEFDRWPSVRIDTTDILPEDAALTVHLQCQEWLAATPEQAQAAIQAATS